jgi:hypothetical protein
MKPLEIIQIVPRLPPTVDGVGDYANLLARQLRAAHGIETRFLVCGTQRDAETKTNARQTQAREGGEPEVLDGFPVHQLKGQNDADLLRVLTQPGMPRTAVLQFVGYGYEKRGCPLWLVRALRAWKAGAGSREQGAGSREQARAARSNSLPIPGRLLTMFHELYASGPPWRTAFWTSPVQRWIVRALARASDRCFTNRTVSAAWLASAGRQSPSSICVLPVLSNLGELIDPPPLTSRKPQMVLYDNVGPKNRKYAADLVRNACGKMGIERVVLVGRGDPAAWSVAGLSVEAAGVVARDDAGRLLAESRAGCLDYFDGYLGKSGIFAAYSAHAIVPLLLSNNHSEADGLQINRHFWAAAALPNETGLKAQQEIASQAHLWYGGHAVAAVAQTYAAALKALLC